MKYTYFVLALFIVVACQDDPKPTTRVEQQEVAVKNTVPPTPKTTSPPPSTANTLTTKTEDNSDKSAAQMATNTPPTQEQTPTSPRIQPNNPPPPAEPAPATSTPPSSEKAAKLSNNTDDDHPYRDITVGTISSACQLITEEDIRKNIPGFANISEIKMIARNSPDNHASACECRGVNANNAFVLGYRKNPLNLEYIDEIIAKGEVREYAPNIPPYEPVNGLGQKAAFNTKHGYLKWVGNNGVLVYSYVFPTTIQNVDNYRDALYKFAQKVDERFHAE